MTPTDSVKLPFYLRVILFLVGFIAITAILFIGKSIFIPLVFAVLIATILHPVVNFFVKIRIKRVFAIILTLVLTFLLILALSYLILSQVSNFSNSWPVLLEKFSSTLNKVVTGASGLLNVDQQKVMAWFEKAQSDMLNSGTAAIGETLIILGNMLVLIFLLPVYVFLILFYQPLLVEFIFRFFGVENREKVAVIVGQIRSVIQNYLFGLVIEAGIVAGLNTAALLLLGIEYAVIIGILGAMINVIPYIGGIVAVAMPMLVAFVTKSSPLYPFYVMAAYFFIQLVDNHYIVPYIVASKVKINALFSVIVVLAGNALWGVPGMFLSIPVLAIIKLICDHIEPLKPWGFLLGDTMPPFLKINRIFKEMRK